MKPTIYTSTNEKIELGDFIVNPYSHHLWQISEDDTDVIKEGKKNGNNTLETVMCSVCRSHKASRDGNGNYEFKCGYC